VWIRNLSRNRCKACRMAHVLANIAHGLPGILRCIQLLAFSYPHPLSLMTKARKHKYNTITTIHPITIIFSILPGLLPLVVNAPVVNAPVVNAPVAL
jgi:hypothetical protein